MSGLGGFLFQTWRPQPNGTFSLVQTMEIPRSATRNGTLVTFTSSLPVMSGDVVGYQLRSNVEDQIQFRFDSLASSVRAYYRQAEETMCQISLCDTTGLTLLPGTPLISVQFSEWLCGWGSAGGLHVNRAMQLAPGCGT